MRPDDWTNRLTAYVLAVQDRPFEWGMHDCCTLAAGWVIELTGQDPMSHLRGHYTNATGARRLMHKYGGLEAMTTAVLGPPIAPAFAQRGDIVLANLTFGPTLGICLLKDALFPGIAKSERVDPGRLEVAWRVAE